MVERGRPGPAQEPERVPIPSTRCRSFEFDRFPGADVDRTLTDDARALLGSARALVAEFLEEGVEEFEPAALPRVISIPSTHAVAPATSEQSAPTPDSTTGEKPTLADVRQELGECTRCRLCEGRNQIVFGDGNPHASLMFIGEGPGQEEDRRGLPFVGRAGELLTKMIEAGLEIPRRDVYICNIVKCRPPKNRNPQPDEVASCKPFLDGQIDAIQPRTIVTLGRPATSLLLGRDVAISRVRGTWQTYRGIPMMPTFHPAYLLRQYTPENRRLVWEDLKKALARSKT